MPGANQSTIVIPISVATNAELALVQGGGVPNTGMEVKHTGLGQYFEYQPQSTVAPDGVSVIAALGGGNWVRALHGIVQSAYAEISANTSTGAGIADLLTVTLQTTGGDLEILATFSAEDSAISTTAFEIWLDGVTIGPGAANGAKIFHAVAGGAGSGSIFKRKTPVAAGSHTVKLRWNPNGGTATINVTANDEHASLSVKEVTR